jgi:hypothetical protein
MEVSPELARKCMANYVQTMKAGNLKPITDSFTETVSYSTRELAEWLLQNNYLETSSELRIAFGIYTAEAAKEVGKPEYEGRLTTFIWPIVNGEPMDPFDGGEVDP